MAAAYADSVSRWNVLALSAGIALFAVALVAGGEPVGDTEVQRTVRHDVIGTSGIGTVPAVLSAKRGAGPERLVPTSVRSPRAGVFSMAAGTAALLGLGGATYRRRSIPVVRLSVRAVLATPPRAPPAAMLASP
jgi:hypothetical protein